MQIIDVTKFAVAQAQLLNGVRAFTIFGLFIILELLSIAYEAKAWLGLLFVPFGAVFILGGHLIKRGNRLVALLCGVFYFCIVGWIIGINVWDERLTWMQLLPGLAITGFVSFIIVQGIRAALSPVALRKTEHIQFRPSLFQRLAHPRRLLNVAVMTGLGVVFFAAGVLLQARYDHFTYTLLPYFFEFTDQSWVVSHVITLAGFLLFAVPFFTYKIAKRHLSASAREVRALDNRPPILILRSFKDDTTEVNQFRSPFFRGPRGARRSFEDVLTEHLWDYGPVIAIGRPGESVPPLGAAREYITGEDWQDRIQELSASAKMILLIIGETVGVLSEIQIITRARLLSRTVFVFPPHQDHWLSLWFCARYVIEHDSLDLSSLQSGLDNLAHIERREIEDVELPDMLTLVTKVSPLFPLLMLPRKSETVCIVGKRRLSHYYRKAIDEAADLFLA